MRKLVYHVATTIDNFIAHEDGSIDGFSMEGSHVTDYLEHLKRYDTVVMGKGTYEIGYKFGMKPGDAPYPHMRHYIFSKSLKLETPAKKVQVVDTDPMAFIKNLKQEKGTDIYLCGGGTFAGFLFDRELIDTLIIKLNPIVFGKGIKLFGDSTKKAQFILQDSKPYDSGVLLMTYKIKPEL